MNTAHNKKRNSCLIYEFLVKYISKNLVDGNETASNSALKILKHYYRPGTELYKEFRLLNALTTTTVSSESVASSVLNEAKVAARSHDLKRLDQEKTSLLHAINRTLSDQDFYDQPVNNYKLLATAQTLANEWRVGVNADLGKTAQYEDAILRSLISTKDQTTTGTLNEESLGTNRLLFKTMLRKINEKYSGSLTNEQKSLLKAYAFSAANDDDTINKKLSEIKGSLLGLIDQYVSRNNNTYVNKKLLEVRSDIEKQHTTPSDETLTKFMLYAKLKTELSSEEQK